MANEHQNGYDKELTLNDLAGMIDALAQSSATGFSTMEANMATKDDLNKVIDMVGSLQGQMSSMETDIKTIKGDVRDVHKRIEGVEKLADAKVSEAEFNDRLRPIEQKLGIPSPK
jgi:hypothetical protein